MCGCTVSNNTHTQSSTVIIQSITYGEIVCMYVCMFQAVSEQGAAWAAGLRAGDLITQLNGESVQGLLHTQVGRTLSGVCMDLHFARRTHKKKGSQAPRTGRRKEGSH